MIRLSAIAMSIVGCTVALVQAGDLNPPGLPSSSMMTLDQIEPRTRVSTLPSSEAALRVISEPGSYYLDRDLIGETGKNGIQITSGNVSLDLMGFSLIGGDGSGHGIAVDPTLRHLQVRNGIITLWDGSGISADETRFWQIEGLTVFRNGGRGVDVDDNTIIQSCVVGESGDIGISTGGNTVIRDCVVTSGLSDGIVGGAGCVVTGCSVRINLGDGIGVDSSSSVLACTSRDNRGDGVEVTNRCRVEGNLIVNNDFERDGTGAGVHATGDDNTITGNSVIQNQEGVLVDGVGNLVVRNNARGNVGAAFSVPTGSNTVGATISGPGEVSGDAWANIVH